MARVLGTAGATDLVQFDVTKWSESDRNSLKASYRRIHTARPEWKTKHAVEPVHPCGWSRDTLVELLDRLEADYKGRSRGEALRHALDDDGWVSRNTVYEIGDYTSKRSLKGHLRPVERIVSRMKAEGVIPDSAISPIETLYDNTATGYSRCLGFRVPMVIVNIWSKVEPID